MNWRGSGGYFGAAASRLPPVRVMTVPEPDPATLRTRAYDAYRQGRLIDAEAIQGALMQRLRATGGVSAQDYLFAGLVRHAAGRDSAAQAILLEGLTQFPDVADLHENLAVLRLTGGDLPGCVAACEQARALGSDTPNLSDILCDAYAQTGRLEEARAEGRRALEAKDRRFGAVTPLVPPPDGPPPAWDPARPAANVIAYALWGDSPRYRVPLLENARIRPHLFPEWTLRVYHDRAVDAAYLGELATLGVALVPMALPPNQPAHRRLLWRFEVIADPAVERFLVRDADSLLTMKERVAVDAWLGSGLHFHAMRDWYSHTDLILAGMWGGVGGILPGPEVLLGAYTGWRAETSHLDQDVLSETVWPIVRDHILIHDSVFQPVLGSVPFPPFATLPAGHHIGENAFLHLSKRG